MATQFDAIDLLSRYETPLLKDMEKDDDVLEWVMAFVGSESFQDSVDVFCEQHAAQFKVLLTKGGPSAADIDAIEGTWKDLHLEFIDTANSYIEGFLVAHDFSMEQYNTRCEEEIRLSEERQRHTRLSFFVQILMACSEYEQFLNLMRRAADPEYYEKKELQYQAEMIVYEGAASPLEQQQQQQEQSQSGSGQVQAAQDFLEFFDQNPNVTLDELASEFQKRVHLGS